jgi:hypothetical protein
MRRRGIRSRKATRTRRCAWWSASRPGARATSSAVSWRQSCRKRSGHQFYVENVAAPAATPAAGQVARRAARRATPSHIISTRLHGEPEPLTPRCRTIPIKDFAPVSLVRLFRPRRGGQSVGAGERRCRAGAADQGTKPGKDRSPAPVSARRRICRASSSVSLQSRSDPRAVHRRGPAIQATHRRAYADRLHGAAAGARRREGRQAAHARGRGGRARRGAARRATFAEQGIKDQDSDTLTGWWCRPARRRRSSTCCRRRSRRRARSRT